MGWLFRNKSRRNAAEQGAVNYVTTVSLDVSKESEFHFFLKDFKTLYQNRYLWPYIERDVIFSLLSDAFVVAHLDSFDPMELDDDIRDLYPNEMNQNGEYAVYLGVNDRRLITAIMEGTDEFWEYGDLINLKAFPASKYTGYPSMALPSIRSATDYKLNIQPIGDDIGLSIAINPKLQNREEIISKIRIVLNEYHMNLEFREMDKI